MLGVIFMKKTINVSFRNDFTRTFDFDIPVNCPHCGNTMSPIIKSAFSANLVDDLYSTIGLLAKCTYENCSHYYALEYILENSLNGYNRLVYSVPELFHFEYSPPIKIDLPENIEQVSPNFIEIYSQATLAESEKLYQIAGVGYRKAAEFLIKDYAISKNPDKIDHIKKTMLGSVIGEYLKDFPKIQSLAKAIAWIGNDETHYQRRHDDKDIQDLKRFIKASAQFIAADYDVDEAIDFTSGN